MIGAKGSLVWLQQPPLNHSLLERPKKVMTNRVLKKLNLVAKRSIEELPNRMLIWDSFVQQGRVGSDGLHFDVPSLKLAAEVITGYRFKYNVNTTYSYFTGLYEFLVLLRPITQCFHKKRNKFMMDNLERKYSMFYLSLSVPRYIDHEI